MLVCKQTREAVALSYCDKHKSTAPQRTVYVCNTLVMSSHKQTVTSFYFPSFRFPIFSILKQDKLLGQIEEPSRIAILSSLARRHVAIGPQIAVQMTPVNTLLPALPSQNKTKSQSGDSLSVRVEQRSRVKQRAVRVGS